MRSEEDKSGKALRVEMRGDGVAVIVYDVPGEPVNTLRASFAEDFAEVFEAVRANPEVRAAILVSGKPL